MENEAGGAFCLQVDIGRENVMFDMQKVGGHIAALRKKMNMTQVDLAERLGISYQAVSSWERGATMPDISKLLELSRALGTTVDAMLCCEEVQGEMPEETPAGESWQDMMAQIGSGIRHQMEEVQEKLQEMQGQMPGGVTVVKKGRNSYVIHIPDEEDETNGKVSADTIGSLAWNMDQETLEDVLVDAINDGDEDIVEEIACYLEPETIDRAVARAKLPLTTEMVEELAMYMGHGALEECIVRAIDEGEDEIVEECACHLDDETMERVLTRCVGELTIDMVEALSCHASEAALDLLIDKCDLEDIDVVEALSPYLNQRQMRLLLKRLRNG